MVMRWEKVPESPSSALQPRSVRTGVVHLTHGANLIATLAFQSLTAGIAPGACQ